MQVQISFQPSGYYLPTGWFEDVGEIYSDQSYYEIHTKTWYNYSWGWKVPMFDENFYATDSDQIPFTNKYIDNGINLEYCDELSYLSNECNKWEIEVQNGFYEIEIGSGKIPDFTKTYAESYDYRFVFCPI